MSVTDLHRGSSQFDKVIATVIATLSGSYSQTQLETVRHSDNDTVGQP